MGLFVFKTHLRAELERGSATTLTNLLRGIERKRAAEINMSEETYELPLTKKGLPPLEEMERRMKRARPRGRARPIHSL